MDENRSYQRLHRLLGAGAAVPPGRRTEGLRAQIASLSPLEQQIVIGAVIYRDIRYLPHELADLVTDIFVRSLDNEELLEL